MISEPEELKLTLEDHEKAIKEVSFLLHNMTGTVSELVGRATRTVALAAGREAAKKMPVNYEEYNLDAALSALGEKIKAGFEFTTVTEDEDVIFTFDKCVIRDMCKDNAEELGGPLCIMFHGYVNGIIAELSKKGVRFKLESTGSTCKIRHLF